MDPGAGRRRHPAAGAQVAELTGLLRHSAGGDRLAGWPADMRILIRRENPHPGAQLSLFEQHEGKRYQVTAISTPRGQVQFLPKEPPGRPRNRRPPDPTAGPDATSTTENQDQKLIWQDREATPSYRWIIKAKYYFSGTEYPAPKVHANRLSVLRYPDSLDAHEHC